MIGMRFLQHKPGYSNASFSNPCQVFTAKTINCRNSSHHESKRGTNNANEAIHFNMLPPTHHGADRCRPSLCHCLIVECRPHYRSQQAEQRFLCCGRAAQGLSTRRSQYHALESGMSFRHAASWLLDLAGNSSIERLPLPVVDQSHNPSRRPQPENWFAPDCLRQVCQTLPTTCHFAWW